MLTLDDPSGITAHTFLAPLPFDTSARYLTINMLLIESAATPANKKKYVMKQLEVWAPAPSPPPSPPIAPLCSKTSEMIDLALGADATASSEYLGGTAALAVDGDDVTRWKSDHCSCDSLECCYANITIDLGYQSSLCQAPLRVCLAI